jgi:hypothetical protein
MLYRFLGRCHVRLAALVDRAVAAAVGHPGPPAARGQGTVEYVALILLVAAVLAGVVAATRTQKFGATGIAETIVRHIKSAMQHVR